MSSNPFRQKSGNFKQQNNNKAHFNGRSRGRFNDAPTRKEKEWGSVKFNPVKAITAEEATPWSKFKHEIVQKERDEKSANAVDMNSAGAKEVLKKREQNYRKMLITAQQKQPTKWEAFSDEEEAPSSAKKQKTSTEVQQTSNGGPPVQQKTQNKQSKKQKAKQKALTDEQVKDFGKRNFALNNHIRKVITKTTYLARGNTLENVVKDMKKRGVKRKKNLE